jgi:ABC-type transport system involved in multi-copper enzyme maturation permease subunit
MMLLPIVERELRVRARQHATYRTRAVAVAAALAMIGPLVAWEIPAAGPPPPAVPMFFSFFTFLLAAACLFEGARQTGDCLSSERREGTLGLLFLTRLRGYDVVLGKWAAAALGCFYPLLAILPVLSLILLAGGITGGEFLRVSLVLLNLLFFALALGMWVSARAREQERSLGAAFSLLVAAALLHPLLKAVQALGLPVPTAARCVLGALGSAVELAFAANYKTGEFWCSWLALQAISWLLLWLACRSVQKYRQEAPGGGGITWLVRQALFSLGVARPSAPSRPPADAAQRAHWLDVNPVLWLTNRGRRAPIGLWILVGALAAIHWVQFALVRRVGTTLTMPVSFALALMVLNFLLWLYVALVAARTMADTRRSGLLELVLATPLSVQEILRGHWLALRRSLLGPLLTFIVVRLLCTVSQNFWLNRGAPGKVQYLLALIQCLSAAVQVFDFITLCCVGAWLGLTSKSPLHAAVKAFALVYLLPSLACGYLPLVFYSPLFRWLGFGTLLGYPLAHVLPMLLKDWLFFQWARQRLRTQFRQAAAGQPLSPWRPLSLFAVRKPWTEPYSPVE